MEEQNRKGWGGCLAGRPHLLCIRLGSASGWERSCREWEGSQSTPTLVTGTGRGGDLTAGSARSPS